MDDAKAYEHVIRLLARRAHSRQELVSKLRQRGASSEVARAAVDRAASHGYVDDLEYARMIARHGRDRGLAPSSTRLDLARRGVDSDTMDTALSEVFADVNLEDLALSLARKRRARLSGDLVSVRRKLAAYLERRGFPVHACLAAVDTVAPLN